MIWYRAGQTWPDRVASVNIRIEKVLDRGSYQGGTELFTLDGRWPSKVKRSAPGKAPATELFGFPAGRQNRSSKQPTPEGEDDRATWMLGRKAGTGGRDVSVAVQPGCR